MSTSYWPNGPISINELFDGRMERFNIREHQHSEATEDCRCLTDGRNFVWVYRDDAGNAHAVTRYGLNAVSTILSAIGQVFATAFISEDDEEGRAFDSDEARYGWLDEQARLVLTCVYEQLNKRHVMENAEPRFGRVITEDPDMRSDMRMLVPVLDLGEREDRLLH
jgi:hypothetical protein